MWPKKLQMGNGRAKKKQRNWSDESDFSDRPKKKKKRNALPAAEIDRSNIVESSRGRRTRGVKVNYSLMEGSSDEADAAAKAAAKADTAAKAAAAARD